MMDLKVYPRLEGMISHSSNIRTLIGEVSSGCGRTQRVSQRPVIEHFLETAEITSWYSSNPVHVKVAILHDGIEDLGLSFQDVERMSAEDGLKVAHMVTALTKRSDLKDRQERNREYLKRLCESIEEEPWILVIKAADRLSNLTDLYALPAEKRRTIAVQTLSFYVPMALRFGFTGLANALKALSLPYVDGSRGVADNR